MSQLCLLSAHVSPPSKSYAHFDCTVAPPAGGAAVCNNQRGIKKTRGLFYSAMNTLHGLFVCVKYNIDCLAYQLCLYTTGLLQSLLLLECLQQCHCFSLGFKVSHFSLVLLFISFVRLFFCMRLLCDSSQTSLGDQRRWVRLTPFLWRHG